jgi:hypothetical protein
VVAVALVVVALAGCSSDPPLASNVVPPAAAVEDRVVFVALGGNETLSRGVDDSLRRAWVQRVFAGLPRAAVFVNLASEEASVARGLADQVPKALELKATIATVWFGAGDAALGTTEAAFTRDLTEVVRQLRAGGVGRVLLLSRTSSARRGSRFAPQIRQVAAELGVRFVEVPASSETPNDASTQDAIADAVNAQLVP